MINNRISPIKDEYIEDYFKNKKLNLRATLDYKDAFKTYEGEIEVLRVNEKTEVSKLNAV